ncbi:MAG: hypothetical protein OEV78_08160 [Spirochaetia bacterium]|nr:hypothetical protein [Spirochaetia bacterium]
MRRSLELGIRSAFFTLVLSFFSIVSTTNGAPLLDEIDTPTGSTLSRGGFDVSLWGYNNGGIFTRALMGVHDNILLGVSFDVQHVIGSDPIVFNIPGVVAKVKVTDGWEDFPMLLAFGYDAFYANETLNLSNISWKSMRMVYGPYVVFSKPFFLLNHEQHFNAGLRVPVQPAFKGEDTSLFLSFDFPIGQFVPMLEIERIFFNSNRLNEILINTGLRFELSEEFALELNLLIGMNKQVTRVITFEYLGAF